MKRMPSSAIKTGPRESDKGCVCLVLDNSLTYSPLPDRAASNFLLAAVGYNADRDMCAVFKCGSFFTVYGHKKKTFFRYEITGLFMVAHIL